MEGAGPSAAPRPVADRIRGIRDLRLSRLRTRTAPRRGSGDEGINGIGRAPIAPVLSVRVAVQAKRYDPGSAVSREPVTLFQRDASAAGAERAVFVTLGRFTSPARKVASFATPNVDLIDGDRLCDLMRDEEVGVKIRPEVDESFFEPFDV